MTRLSLLLVAGLLLGGCKNSCQSACESMAEVATECGYSVPDSEIDACVEQQADADKEAKDSCSTFGDPEVIRDQWTCEDLGDYWGSDGATE